MRVPRGGGQLSCLFGCCCGSHRRFSRHGRCRCKGCRARRLRNRCHILPVACADGGVPRTTRGVRARAQVREGVAFFFTMIQFFYRGSYPAKHNRQIYIRTIDVVNDDIEKAEADCGVRGRREAANRRRALPLCAYCVLRALGFSLNSASMHARCSYRDVELWHQSHAAVIFSVACIMWAVMALCVFCGFARLCDKPPISNKQMKSGTYASSSSDACETPPIGTTAATAAAAVAATLSHARRDGVVVIL